MDWQRGAVVKHSSKSIIVNYGKVKKKKVRYLTYGTGKADIFCVKIKLHLEHFVVMTT